MAPNIELEPHDYRVEDPNTGRWRVHLSKRWYRNYFLFACAILALVYWRRHDVTVDQVLPFAIGMSMCAGGMLFGWLKDVH